MLAIAGGKGGCGKTTTTLGLTLAFARQRRPCLAVDADLDMPNLHAMADLERTPHLGDTADAPPKAIAHSVSTGSDALVLPAPPTNADCDLRTALERVRDISRPVFVDCPAGAGRTAVDPLRAADRVLLVTTLQSPSLKDAAKTAAMARQLDTSVVGTVLTRTNGIRATDSTEGSEGSGATSLCERVERLLDCPVLTTVPEQSQNERSTPMFTDSVIAAAYTRLASALE